MKLFKRFIALTTILMCSLSVYSQYYYVGNTKVMLTVDSTVMYVELNDNVKITSFDNDAVISSFPSKNTALIKQSAIKESVRFTDTSVGYRFDDGYRIWATRKICVKLKAESEYSKLLPFIEDSKSVVMTRSGYYLVEMNSSSDAMSVANKIYEAGIAAFSHVDFYTPIERYQDPLYGDQFQMHNTGQTIDGYPGEVDCDIDAPEAWNVTLGSPNIIVSVIDDGMEDHSDFDSQSGTSRLIGGFTPAINGNGTPLADGRHGVACAGIISASHDGIGIMGVSPLSKMLSVNIFTGGETTADLADAFTWSVENGADVISNSWGYTSCSAAFSNITAAINDAATNGRDGKGCVIVFASGNNNFPCVTFPGNLPSVVAVGAVTNQGQRSWYSNYGSELDLVAPSNGKAGVRTTDRMGSSGYTFTNYTNSFGGTSAACPLVSGVAALALSMDYDLTSEQVYEILTTTADDMGPDGFDNQYAFGRVNAITAIECVLDTANCVPDGGGGNPPLTCDVPTNLEIKTISTTSASFEWDVMPYAQSYVFKYRKVNGNGATTAYLYDNKKDVYNLEPGTLYECQVKSNCGNNNLSDWSPVVVFATDEEINFDADSYCNAYGEFSTTGYIDFFSLSNITSITGDDDGYLLYNNEVIFLEQYEDYYISYSKETPTNNEYMYFSFYIDYDGSSSFDSDELVYQVRKRYNSIYSAAITIPNQTILGYTMMRVIAKKGSYASPCEVFTVGEVEDYIVFINGDIDVDVDEVPDDLSFSINPNPVLDIVLVESDYDFTQLNLYDLNGKLVGSYLGNFDKSFELDLSGHNPGLYMLELVSSNGIFVKRLIKQ